VSGFVKLVSGFASDAAIHALAKRYSRTDSNNLIYRSLWDFVLESFARCQHRIFCFQLYSNLYNKWRYELLGAQYEQNDQYLHVIILCLFREKNWLKGLEAISWLFIDTLFSVADEERKMG